MSPRRPRGRLPPGPAEASCRSVSTVVAELAQREERPARQRGLVDQGRRGLPCARAALAGDAVDLVERLRPDPARRHVDDAPERDAVPRVGHEPQVREHVPHLAPLVEADAAHHQVGEPQPQQALLDQPALRVHPEQHRHAPLRAQRRGAARDPGGLLELVRRPRAAAPARPRPSPPRASCPCAARCARRAPRPRPGCAGWSGSSAPGGRRAPPGSRPRSPGCSRCPPRARSRSTGPRRRPPSGCRRARPAGAPAGTGCGSCPGTRPPAGTGSARARPRTPARRPRAAPPRAAAGRRSRAPRPRRAPRGSPAITSLVRSSPASGSRAAEFLRAEMRERKRRGGCSFSERSSLRIASRTAASWSSSS